MSTELSGDRGKAPDVTEPELPFVMFRLWAAPNADFKNEDLTRGFEVNAFSKRTILS